MPYPRNALEARDEIQQRLEGRQPALFLDYDGTLTPIVARPELAILPEETRALLKELAQRFPVAIVSGRDLADVRKMVGLDDLVYAGSHGFDIQGPGGLRLQNEQAKSALPDLDAAESALNARITDIKDAWVERKHFAIAVHYRQVDETDAPRVETLVKQVQSQHPALRLKGGKKIWELQADIEWDKGRAVLWLLEHLGLDRPNILPIYMGDDVTDEDAFRALADRGMGIGVGVGEDTAAHYTLRDTDEVAPFLRMLREA
ncbi:MAG: trehalose-phosphatase [Candidatus Hydrogenedentales bacterium]